MTFHPRARRRAGVGNRALTSIVGVLVLSAALLAFGGDAAVGARQAAIASPVGVSAFGTALAYGAPSEVNEPLVGIAATPDGKGYWLAAADGGVFTFGDAGFYGSAGNIALYRPIVGMAATPDGKGYWLAASDGGVFTFGDAGFDGSAGNIALYRPIVGMAATPDGKGYWLVAADGGVFTFGDAGFYGSTGNVALNEPIVGMAATPDGKGYWLVAADGGVFTFGDAGFYGSTGNVALNEPIVGMAATPDGKGYWLVAADGGVFTFGDAGFYGSTGGAPATVPTVGLAVTPDGKGYWTATSIKLPPRTCQTSQLSVVSDPAHSGGGAAGSLGMTYVFTNTSTTTCTLGGFPVLQLLGASGQPLTTTTIHASQTPTTVTLPPAGQAWFDIEFPTQTGFGNLQCPVSSALAVTPPDNTTALRISGSGGQIGAYGGDIPHLMCGNITTSPVLPEPPF